MPRPRFRPSAVRAALAALALLTAASTAPAGFEPTAVLMTGTATISPEGTTFTPDPLNTGLQPNARTYEEVSVNSGAVLRLEGYDFQPFNIVVPVGGSVDPMGKPVGFDLAKLTRINRLVAVPGSTIDVAGGIVYLGANVNGGHQGSVLNLSGGLIIGVSRFVNNTTINMTGGVLGYEAGTPVKIGGTANLSGGWSTFLAGGNATVNVTGGSVYGYVLTDHGTLKITGTAGYRTSLWEVNHNPNDFGGLNNLVTKQNSTIDLFGNFPGFAPGTIIPSGKTGTITGTLALPGSLLHTFNYDTTAGGQIEFNVGPMPAPVPELGSVWLLAVGLLGLTGLAARRSTSAH